MSFPRTTGVSRHLAPATKRSLHLVAATLPTAQQPAAVPLAVAETAKRPMKPYTLEDQRERSI